ncbi:MAG: amidohydrolase family protein [Desulfovibrionaceae bacterium]|nr:amidohydrolase family protein [Desulfovibrionaceae bacterium]
MKIFDFRFRPNTKEILDGIANSAMFKASCEASGFDKRVAQTLPEIVDDLKKRGVCGGVITGRDCETTYGSPANNGSVLEFCRAYPDFFYGFWGIDPHKGMNSVREVEKVVKEYGMRGIATDPYLAHIKPSEARYYPIYAKCCELNVPVFITTAPPPAVQGALIEYTDPRDVDKVARDFPELVIIMSHGGYPFVQEAIFTCQRNPNVYMDLSEYELAPMATHYIESLTKGILADKIIFASAHPFIEQVDAIKNYMEMGLSEETLEKVLYKNAARILGLSL